MKVIREEWKGFSAAPRFPAAIKTNILPMELFHATTRAAAESILRQGRMDPGRGGIFGAGIYFAAKPEIAQRKCQHDKRPHDVVIQARVDLGKAAMLDQPCPAVTPLTLRQWGCNSIQERQKPESDWEYMVFDPGTVHLLSIVSNGVTIWSAGQTRPVQWGAQ
jgi:hypothetical protein